MKRRSFLGIAGGALATAGGLGYLLSDRDNLVRADVKNELSGAAPLKPEESEILFLASLAPSGHNTQPWLVKYVEPYHWIIGSDKTRWLPAVDPAQRETILSIGAFLQNLEYAASNAGYRCQFDVRAATNQDEDICDVKMTRSGDQPAYDTARIKNRRTVRSNFLSDPLKTEDKLYLFNGESDHFYFIPSEAKENVWLNDQTIAANIIQTDRDAAQAELADWIRFSSKDANKYRDGLTPASMEIEGVSGWVIRNFYDKTSVMKKGFRDQGIDNVRTQVSRSAGWLVITSKDNSTATLIETGRRMQRLFLKVQEKGIAIHPMTQILEESQTRQAVNQSIGINDPIQFLLRLGYLKSYPEPVSLRRPIDQFVKA